MLCQFALTAVNKTSLALQPGGCSGLIPPWGERKLSPGRICEVLGIWNLRSSCRTSSVISDIPWLYLSLAVAWGWSKGLKDSSFKSPKCWWCSKGHELNVGRAQSQPCAPVGESFGQNWGWVNSWDWRALRTVRLAKNHLLFPPQQVINTYSCVVFQVSPCTSCFYSCGSSLNENILWYYRMFFPGSLPRPMKLYFS